MGSRKPNTNHFLTLIVPRGSSRRKISFILFIFFFWHSFWNLDLSLDSRIALHNFSSAQASWFTLDHRCTQLQPWESSVRGSLQIREMRSRGGGRTGWTWPWCHLILISRHLTQPVSTQGGASEEQRGSGAAKPRLRPPLRPALLAALRPEGAGFPSPVAPAVWNKLAAVRGQHHLQLLPTSLGWKLFLSRGSFKKSSYNTITTCSVAPLPWPAHALLLFLVNNMLL